MPRKQVYEHILTIAHQLARRREGALFIVGKRVRVEPYAQLLYPGSIVDVNVTEKDAAAVVGKLATLDGATLINTKGELYAYGARLTHSRVLPGHGTKHAAARGITEKVPSATAILVSEETGLIKVFKQGRIILQMDAQDVPRPLFNKILAFLSEGDTALLTAAGASAAILGAAAVPTVLIAGGAYLAIKTATKAIKDQFT